MQKENIVVCNYICSKLLHKHLRFKNKKRLDYKFENNHLRKTFTRIKINI